MQIKMKKTCSHRIIPSKTNEVIAQSKREKKRWGYVRIEAERAGRHSGYSRIAFGIIDDVMDARAK